MKKSAEAIVTISNEPWEKKKPKHGGLTMAKGRTKIQEKEL
jgi:hypothetical protein